MLIHADGIMMFMMKIKRKLNDYKFTFSSKDLQAVKYIKDLMQIGVSSLKIEGRMKSEHYLGTIIGAYRRIIDDIYEGREINEKEKYPTEMAKAETVLLNGFLLGSVGEDQQIFDRTSEVPFTRGLWRKY